MQASKNQVTQKIRVRLQLLRVIASSVRIYSWQATPTQWPVIKTPDRMLAIKASSRVKAFLASIRMPAIRTPLMLLAIS